MLCINKFEGLGLGLGYGVVRPFNSISAISLRSVLLVEETGVSGENHRLVASHWQIWSHNGVWSTPRHERDSNSQRIVLWVYLFVGQLLKVMSTLYTIKYIDNGWGHRLSLIELNVISFIYDNFCVTKIKYITQNIQDYSVHL